MSGPKVIRSLRRVEYDSQIALAETDDILAAVDIHSITGYDSAAESDNTFTLASLAARIEHPRNVVVTITVGGFTGGYVRVYGMGMAGFAVNELFTLTGAGTFTGNIPFLTVDRVSVWGCTGTVGESDHISIGIGAKIGVPLSSHEKLVDVVKERFDHADVAITGTVNRQYGTYIPASTLDAAKVLELWYTTDMTLTW
jgi:hypothetical protein